MTDGEVPPPHHDWLLSLDILNRLPVGAIAALSLRASFSYYILRLARLLIRWAGLCAGAFCS